MEEMRFLTGVFDVCFEKKAVHLGVDVFDGDLKTIEGASLRQLHLQHEAAGKVLKNDSVRCSKEGQNVSYEVALVRGEGLIPVAEVLGEVDFLCCPEGGFGLLVHLPNLRIADRKHTEAVGIWGKKGLFLLITVVCDTVRDRQRRHFWQGKREAEIEARSTTGGFDGAQGLEWFMDCFVLRSLMDGFILKDFMSYLWGESLVKGDRCPALPLKSALGCHVRVSSGVPLAARVLFWYPDSSVTSDINRPGLTCGLQRVRTLDEIPGVAGHRTHAAEEYGNGDHSQTYDATNSTAISSLKGKVKYLSNGITPSIIISVQKIWDVGNSKCDTNLKEIQVEKLVKILIALG
ncbi:hypothetical protein M5K25_025281 [Dendrobium thyrsiflorum]|uniref:Uncharacterized protein n=1 Tax=Dendrobium thyrsiflorum TaxID=117978 RepID=A0ABD0U900_DENTH